MKKNNPRTHGGRQTCFLCVIREISLRGTRSGRNQLSHRQVLQNQLLNQFQRVRGCILFEVRPWILHQITKPSALCWAQFNREYLVIAYDSVYSHWTYIEQIYMCVKDTTSACKITPHAITSHNEGCTAEGASAWYETWVEMVSDAALCVLTWGILRPRTGLQGKPGTNSAPSEPSASTFTEKAKWGDGEKEGSVL